MIFDSFVLSLEPSRYIPFDDVVDGVPREIFEDSEVIVSPAPVYVELNTFLGDGGRIAPSQTLVADLGIDSDPFTLAFWIQVDDEAGSFEPLYFMDSDSRGTIITLQGDTLIHSFGDGTQTQSFSYGAAVNIGEPNLIAIAYDGSTYRLVVNDSQLTESGVYSVPAQTSPRFFSSNDSSEKAITHIFAAESAIANEFLWKGYSVGVRGKEIRKVLSGDEIELSQGDIESLQTSWQAYGIVVTKR